MITKNPYTIYFSRREMDYLKRGNTLNLTFSGKYGDNLTLAKLTHHCFSAGNFKRHALTKLMDYANEDGIATEEHKFSLRGLQLIGFNVRLIEDLRKDKPINKIII